MKYKVYYFQDTELEKVTGLRHKQIILTKTLIKLIESKKVNVKIRHWPGEISTCWIDLGDFRQR